MDTLVSQCGDYQGNKEKGYAIIEPLRSYDKARAEEVASGGKEDNGREKGLKIIKIGLEDGRNGYEVFIVRLRTDSNNSTNLDSEISLSIIYFTLNIIPL